MTDDVLLLAALDAGALVTDAPNAGPLLTSHLRDLLSDASSTNFFTPGDRTFTNCFA